MWTLSTFYDKSRVEKTDKIPFRLHRAFQEDHTGQRQCAVILILTITKSYSLRRKSRWARICFYKEYLSGSTDALEKLVLMYGDKLVMYINGYICDIHESEDILIDVFCISR